MPLIARLCLALVLAVTSLTAYAALPLQGRDINGNPIAANDPSAVFEYDPNLNLTWLRDWNANGAHPLGDQLAWAASLTYFGGGWRLPSQAGLDGTGLCTTPCVGGEMGYMWYVELGN